MNPHDKVTILFSVLALGLMVMIGSTVREWSFDLDPAAPAPTLAPTRAILTASPTPVEFQPILIVVTSTPEPVPTAAHQPTAVIVLPDPKPAQAQKPPASDGCIERWDRVGPGAPTTYGFKQAQADGLIYSYGIFGDGTLENPYGVLVYTNCLELTR